ncbi:hypothetical protein [Hymenobacter chitinivorans]|uniref:Uncharacterized protein n=1 Tax=Hymenobacter chitinivorans DSM 11115 TaxID=1121954 RepID=A0A2M9BLC7_9BACT|nr:hypothetical protein [Hymenobacter chitinivorans]PJJ58720.1 hypothetical protein CLV45_0130 [Hymenobacter chitinivorans DSM 11115]
MATDQDTTANTDDKKHQATPPGTSSQSLADSEMSVGKGALNTEPGDEQENKEADRNAVRPGQGLAPSEAAPKADWGGQFGNSVQPVYHDADRLENQLASPGRGEFGPQDTGGTQGGYGNQYRANDVYGGQLGSQPVNTGGYQGGRPENNTGTDEYNPQGSTFGHATATPLAGTTVDPHYRNDNASPTAPDSGFSEDYGHSSLVGGAGNAQAGTSHERNQSADYDYIPSQGSARDEQPGTSYNPQPTVHGRTGELNGANEPGPNREAATPTGSDSRTGYTRTEGETSYQGNSGEGIGSKGGSYNDPNDSSNPAAADGGAAQQDYSRDAQNNAPVPPHDNGSDYGTMPRRNAGRDNDADRS